MSGCDLRPTAVGRALHALEPEDERLIVEHLAHCATCRRALRDTYAVMALLAAAAPAVDPPADLRDRVLALADGPDERAAVPGPTPQAPTQPPTLPTVVDVGKAPAPAPSGARRWGLLAVAAVVLGVVLLSARALLPGDGPGGVGDPAGSPSALTDRASRIVDGAEAADPSGRQATLRRADGTPVAVVLDDAAGARVVPLALPPPGTGRAYFLWRVVGAQPLPVGVLDPAGVSRAPSGPASTEGPVTAYAISMEPAEARPSSPSNLVADGPAV